MDDFLKDNSVVTIYLDPQDPDDGSARADAADVPVALDSASIGGGIQLPAEVIAQAIEESPSDVTVDVPDEMSAKMPIGTSAEVVVKASARVPDELSMESRVNVALDAHVGTSNFAETDNEFDSTSDIYGLDTLGEKGAERGLLSGLYDDPDNDTDAQSSSVPVVNPRRAPRVNPVSLDSETDKYGVYQDAVSSSNTLGIGLVLLLCAIALIVALWVGFGFITNQAKEQGAQTLRDSIIDASMQCFAIEGYYPPSLEYLQENYGLSVNEDDYLVVYVAFASNVPPTVDVRMR